MFHSRDHNSLGQTEPVQSDMTTNTPDDPRDLDEVGHAVVPRTIPCFWKPVADWRVD